MDERYSHSLIDSSKNYIHDLRFLGKNDPTTLKALTTYKIGHLMYYWANMIGETETNKKKIEKFLNCVIMNNPNIILPTSDPMCLYYSNVNTPQTDYTWQELCAASTYDSVDHTTEVYSLSVISSGATQVPIKVSTPDRNEQGDGVTSFLRSYNKGVEVTLTAPTSSLISGAPFQRWTINGSPQPIGLTTVDLIMDKDTSAVAVYIAPTVLYKLTVLSSNPNSGVYITVDKVDETGLSSGNTSFERSYTYNTAVTVTAPSKIGNAYFQRWSVNGVAQAEGITEITITMNSQKIATAIYETDSVFGTLIFEKIVTNDYLDPLDETEFTFTATYGSTVLEGSFSQNHPTTFYNVPVGDYVVVEDPSSRHTLVGIYKNPVTFDQNNLTQTITIINKQIPETGSLGTLTINKTVVDEGVPVDDPTVFNVTIRKDGTLIANGKVSQSRSMSIDNLPLGTYTVEETLIDGYTPTYDVSPITLTLAEPDGVVEITNERSGTVVTTGTLNINKVMLNGGPADDAQLFTVTVEGPTIKTDYTVSKNVPLVIEDLEFGAYIITETVPAGYRLISISPSTFNLSSSNLNQVVTITNTTCGEEIECTFDPEFDFYEPSSVSVLSVGNLVSDTVTFDEYVIDWFRDEVHAMVSGYNTTDPSVETFHPFTGTEAVPVLPGTWVPVIRYVVIDGVKIYNSPTGTGRDCEDWCTNLSDLPVIIVVSPLTCSSTNAPVTLGYNFRLSYSSSQDYNLASRKVQFDLPTDLSAKYFAIWFSGVEVVDKIQIYLNNESTEAIIDASVGSRNISASVWVKPTFYYGNSQKIVFEIPEYVSGDYLIIKVTPSVLEVNPRTDWTLDMKCLDDTHNFSCELDPVTHDNTITSLTLTNNVSSCRYELLATIPNMNFTYSTVGSDFYDFYYYAGLSLRGASNTSVDYVARTFTLQFPYGSAPISDATSYPSATVFKSSYGNVNISKTGNVFTVVCADSRDYDAYVTGYNYLLASAWWSGYNPDSTNINYYRFFYFQQRYKEGGCGDGYTYDTFYIHRSAAFTFNGTNTITITVPLISNNYRVGEPCDTSYTYVNSYVTTAINTYNKADYSQNTGCIMTAPLGYGLAYTGVTNIHSSTRDGYRSLYMNGNLTSPCSNIEGFSIYNNDYCLPIQSLAATITAAKDVDGNYIEDPAENFEVYSRIGDDKQLKNTNQRLLYKIVGGVEITNILPHY